MRENEPQAPIELEVLKKQKLEIVDHSSDVINLRFSSPMVLPFGEISNRPSGIAEVSLNIGGNIFKGIGEGATLQKALFTDDSGENIAENIEKILIEIRNNGQISLEEAATAIRNIQFPDDHRFPTARLSVEMALIDATAKSLGKNVADMLGISTDREVPYGKSISGRSSQETLADVDKAAGLKAKKIKIKISPSTFIEVYETLKIIQVRYKDLELMVDANGSFDPSNPEHLKYLSQLDSLGLLMIEEPVSRAGEERGLNAVRRFKKNLPTFNTRLCLDDCLVDLATTNTAIDEELCDIVNIKPGRIGSFFLSIDVANLCYESGKQVMVGGMFEATPGRIMTTTLAGYLKRLNFDIPGDLSLAQERLSEDLVSESDQLQIGTNGGIIIPSSPGWGFEMKKGVFNHE